MKHLTPFEVIGEQFNFIKRSLRGETVEKINYMNKENLEEHAQTQKNEATRDDEREEFERRERNASEDFPNGDMAEPYDLRGDR